MRTLSKNLSRIVISYCAIATVLVPAKVPTQSQPKFTVTPVSANIIQLLPTGSDTAQYTITNNTSTQKTLYMTGVPAGVTQNTLPIGFARICGSTFTLDPAPSPNSFCTLFLNIDGSTIASGATTLPKTVSGGPQVCVINADGSNSSTLECSQPTADNILQVTISGSPYAYITDQASSSIQKCNIDAFSGNLFGCQVTSATGLTAPVDMSINKAKNLMYISDTTNSGGFLSTCDITSSGNLNNCNNYTSITPIPPSGVSVTLNPAATYIYTSTFDGTSGTIVKCLLDGNGQISSCDTAGDSSSFPVGSNPNNFSFPGGITFNSAGNIVYITDLVANVVYQCSIDTNNNLTNCTTTGSGFNYTIYTELNPAGTLAYITNYEVGLVSVCQIVHGGAADGNLTNCMSATNFDFGTMNPGFVAINTANTVAYITDHITNQITQCKINQTNGIFENCVANTIPGTSGPTGIILY